MHDLLHLLISLAATPTPSPSSSSVLPTLIPSPVPTPVAPGSSTGLDSSVKVAIVTTIGVVLAAGITAIASTFQREKSPRSTVTAADKYTRDYINGLLQDQREYRKLQKKYNSLREGCIEHGLDPDHLIHEQEQQGDH